MKWVQEHRKSFNALRMTFVIVVGFLGIVQLLGAVALWFGWHP